MVDLVTAPVVYGILQPGPDAAGGTPYIRPTEIQNDLIQVDKLRRTTPAIAHRYRRSSLEADDILLSIVGTIGKVAVVPRQLAGANITQSSARLRMPPGILPKFAAYALRSSLLTRQFDSSRLGTAVPRLNIAHVRDLRLPVAPLREQSRIVDALASFLSRLDDAVATLERVQRNLKRYRASVLKAAVDGRLVTTEAELARMDGRDYEPASVLLNRILAERRRRWEEAQMDRMTAKGHTPKDDRWKARYPEPAQPDTAELPSLPEGWCWTSMDQVGEVSGGITQNANRDTLPLQLPYLRVANVYANELRLDDVRTIGLAEAEVERALLKRGDLLVVEGNGSVEQIGRVAVWDGSVEPCVHQNHLIKVRSSPAIAEWSLSWLLAPAGRRAIVRVASSTSGLHTLSLSKIAALPVPLPPAAEQERITDQVERLTTAQQATHSEAAKAVARCKRLRQSVLTWAFEGKLVEQDPNDEPATVLLERIRAAREQSAADKPLKKRSQFRNGS